MTQRILVVETEQPTGEQQFFKNIVNSFRKEQNNPNNELVSWNSNDKNCSVYVVDESKCIIRSEILGYYDTVGSTYSNGQFVDPKASCFVTTTIKISLGYTKSIWCIKGKYYVLQSTVWDKYISIQDISLTSHIIKSIDTKYGYPILSPQDFLENPDVVQVFLSGNDDGLKKNTQVTIEVPKEKIQETPKTKQDCIDTADKMLGTATSSTVTDIIDNVFDDYLLCMKNIGRPLGPVEPMYGFTSSQADKIQGTQDDCEYFAITKNTNNQEKMQIELQKCRMQYIEMAQTAMHTNKVQFNTQSNIVSNETLGPHSGEGVISDEKSCITMIEGSKWNPTSNTCVVSSFTIHSGKILTISSDVTLSNSKGIITNNGILTVLGNIINFGAIENFGTIHVSGKLGNQGNLNNTGIITVNSTGEISNAFTSNVNNFGTILNEHRIINFGQINNHCNASISGNPLGDDSGFGDNPINYISCKIIPEKVEYVSEEPVSDVKTASEKGGGCLIATATYGSELAPQVQQLRELRDNQLLQTASGTSFMSGFNQFYYSFSPQIADFERENPVFKEAVKIAITPMLSTLSIMTLADSETKVLGFGISVILLNLGIYVVGPVFGISKIKTHIQRKQTS